MASLIQDSGKSSRIARLRLQGEKTKKNEKKRQKKAFGKRKTRFPNAHKVIWKRKTSKHLVQSWNPQL